MSGFRRRLMAGLPTAKLTTIRIDQNLTDPATMITRIVDEGGIEAIRANSHRYVGVFDSTANLMSLRQLDDNDGTKYLDGTDAPITTLGNDVWMKLPQFWYKAEEYDTDVWDITFAYGGKPDSTFKEWDGKDLIGVYEAYVSLSKLYSVSGVNSSGGISQSNYKTYARNRGDGFTLVKWKHHCMIAMLFYSMYNHTDSQKIIGYGTNSYIKQTGQTNTLGMTDTVGGGNGDSMSINCWGLENWWGNKAEWIEGITANGSKVTIPNDDGTDRTVSLSMSGYGLVGKFKFGDYLDLIATSLFSVNNVMGKGYCDYYELRYYSSHWLYIRSSSYNLVNGGISALYAYDNSPASNFGTRLSYRGDYIITD